MAMRFDGKVLLTTGGGSGLAAAVARRFASEGGRVAVLDLDGARATAVAAELKGSIGLAVDVASEEGVRDAVGTAHREMGRIDCVFNAAGHADFGPIETWTLERWNRMMGVHVGGTFLVCKYVLPIMRSQGEAPLSMWRPSLPWWHNPTTHPTARPKALSLGSPANWRLKPHPCEGQCGGARAYTNRHDCALVAAARWRQSGSRCLTGGRTEYAQACG